MEKGQHKRKILILTEKDVRSLLVMKDAIEVMEKIFRAYEENKTQMIARQYLLIDEHQGRIGFMPAYVTPMAVAGVKIVSAHKQNPSEYALPTVQATTLLSDAKTGLPIALIGASYSTMIRTGAVAALAAKYLSRKDSKVAGIIGAGAQGIGQLMGLGEVRDIQKAFVYDISEQQRERYAKDMSGRLGIEVIPVGSAQEATMKTDILAIATPSSIPVVKDEWVPDGIHINTVGVSTEGKQEVCTETFQRSKCIVDQFEQTSRIGGISVPVSSGVLDRGNIYAELGELVTGKKTGRISRDEITVFVSSGLSIQDVAVAHLVYEKARAKGMGMAVEWEV